MVSGPSDLAQGHALASASEKAVLKIRIYGSLDEFCA